MSNLQYTTAIVTNLDCEVLKRKSCFKYPNFNVVLLKVFKVSHIEFTTHIHNLETGGLTSGNYFTTLKAAEKDFEIRH